MVGYCETCLNQHKAEVCRVCADNPDIFHMVSYYTPYLEVCPLGNWGCSDDPGFIQHYFPDRYQKKFGDIPLKTAVKHENSKCMNCPYREEEKK